MPRFSHVVFSLLVTFAGAAPAQPAEPRGGPRRPPPEALAACEGKSAGTACSFTHDGRALAGTCFTPASDRPLACRPAGAPPHGPNEG
jgi:hypothetical protein